MKLKAWIWALGAVASLSAPAAALAQSYGDHRPTRVYSAPAYGYGYDRHARPTRYDRPGRNHHVRAERRHERGDSWRMSRHNRWDDPRAYGRHNRY